MSDGSSCGLAESWITVFCSVEGHEYFVEISDDFIEDEFNLTGLSSMVKHYREALDMILDIEPLSDSYSSDDSNYQDERDGLHGYGRKNGPDVPIVEIERSAKLLYGLIHQRYIITRIGLSRMREKFKGRYFGHCPRVNCRGSHVLPYGRTNTPQCDTVKLFCPSCLDLYTPQRKRHQTLDGAYFGTTFASLFMLTYPDDFVPKRAPQYPHIVDGERTINGFDSLALAPFLGEARTYVPRIYGFKVSEFSQTGPRMRWLRSKPADMRELNEAAAHKAKQEKGPAGEGAPVEADAEAAGKGAASEAR